MAKEWIESYIKFLKVGDFDNMIPLKLQNFPASLFKYRALNSVNLDCLEGNYLWLADVNTFNDPFECSLLLDNENILKDMFTSHKFLQTLLQSGFSNNEINKIKSSPDPFEVYLSILRENGTPHPLSREQQKERIQKAWLSDTPFWKETLRVCSFSETNDSLLMWAHYANEYKGICVEYDLLDLDQVRTFIQPVYYTLERASVKSFNDLNSYFYVFASINKSLDWEYEREWRLTYFTESQLSGKNNRQLVSTPKAIYLGPRFEHNSKEYKERMRSIASKMGIPLKPMQIHRTEYKLVLAS